MTSDDNDRKTNKKKTNKKKTSTKTVAQTDGVRRLPAGFKPLQSGGVPWDMEAMPVLVGEWKGVRTIEVKRGRKMEEQRLATVLTDDDRLITVWESAMLRDLFDTAEEGDRVAIIYHGLGKAKPGQNPPKLFEVGIQQAD